MADRPRPLLEDSFTERHRVVAALLTLVALAALGVAVGAVLGQALARVVEIVVSHLVGTA